jgi:glycosyltransferase involved in cell wall biosynthesis
MSSGVVAQKASERTGIPYVLDFRDPWGLNYYEREAKRLSTTAISAHRMMYTILEKARAVVFMFETVAECYWRAYQGALDAKKIHIIPNGYDGSIEEFMVPNGDKCIILYTGVLSTYRYDTLLQALDIFRKTEPVQANRLRVLFVGEGMEGLAREAATLGLSDIVETMGTISYAEILCLQREAHAFLIFGRKSDRKGHELVAGAKLFGYLQGRRPIIGVLPQDETKKILYRLGVSTIAEVDSLPEIVTALRRVLDAWLKGTLASLLPDRTACEAYSAEQQTSAMVRALEALPPTEGFVPGSVEIPQSLRGEVWNGRC